VASTNKDTHDGEGGSRRRPPTLDGVVRQSHGGGVQEWRVARSEEGRDGGEGGPRSEGEELARIKIKSGCTKLAGRGERE
jgi:hypothetical protein